MDNDFKEQMKCDIQTHKEECDAIIKHNTFIKEWKEQCKRKSYYISIGCIPSLWGELFGFSGGNTF